ncbi:hypothetical protein K1X76_02605 [bacterium]|nr:hypothetical protein [bacterium]
MNTTDNHSNSSYHEETGDVYLAFLKKNQTTQTDDYPPTLNLISLEIKNFKDSLLYNEREDTEDLTRLTVLVNSLYDSIQRPVEQKKIELRKTTVTLSGEKMVLNHNTSLIHEDILTILIGFPGYPFKTVECEVTVLSCLQEGNFYKVELGFTNIDESHRDIIIKYVNHLQRHNIKKTKHNENS